MDMKEQDSFEEYKKYLEASIGDYGVLQPPRIMTPYSRFCFERSSQQKKMNRVLPKQFQKSLSNEWDQLEESKKMYYQKIYEVRVRQRQQLQEEYEILANKKKGINGYTLFYKKKFEELSAQNQIDHQLLNEIVTNIWRSMQPQDKQKYNEAADKEKKKIQFSESERQERVRQHNQKIRRFRFDLKQEKQRILKKYQLDRDSKQKIKMQKKAQREKTKRIKKQETQKRREQLKKKRKKSVRKKTKPFYVKQQPKLEPVTYVVKFQIPVAKSTRSKVCKSE